MSSPRGMYNELVVAVGLEYSATSTASDVAVETFDRLNGSNPVHDLVAVIDVDDVIAPVTVTLVESDTTDVASAMTAVADDEVQGGNPLSLTTSNDNGQHVLGYLGDARYVGIQVAGTGYLDDLVVWWLAANPRANVR